MTQVIIYLITNKSDWEIQITVQALEREEHTPRPIYTQRQRINA